MRSGSNDKRQKKSIGFAYAWNGLLEVLKTERNFQFHIIAAILAITISFILNISVVEWTAILIVIGLVLFAEMINTAIERILDYLKPDIHPKAKAIKDIAAGAVLVTAMVAVIIGILIFLPKLNDLFNL